MLAVSSPAISPTGHLTDHPIILAVDAETKADIASIKLSIEEFNQLASRGKNWAVFYAPCAYMDELLTDARIHGNPLHFD
ncbi:MAG: hypothetical protein ACPG32_04215 [Akkermansiaceae bacterium]